MSITVLQDVILSNRVIAQGVKGRQMRRNQRVETANGFMSVNMAWDKTLREYEIGIGPLRRSAWQYLETLFEVTGGGAFGFLMLDPKDFAALITEGRVAAVVGQADTYQLYKRYVEPVSSRYVDRKITRPNGSTVTVYASGTPIAVTLDPLTGMFTVSGQNASALTWSGQFYTPVHFKDDQIDWTMVVAGSDPDARFYTGPTCVLSEIRE